MVEGNSTNMYSFFSRSLLLNHLEPQSSKAKLLLPIMPIRIVAYLWLAKWCKILKVYIHSHSMLLLLFTNIFIHIQQPNLHSRNIFIHIYQCISYSRLYFAHIYEMSSFTFIHIHDRNQSCSQRPRSLWSGERRPLGTRLDQNIHSGSFTFS